MRAKGIRETYGTRRHTPGGSFIRMPRGGATPFPSPCPRQAEEEQQWRMAGGVEDLGDDELPPAIGVAVLFFLFF